MLKKFILYLTALFCITGTLCAQPITSDVCLTPNEYRFYCVQLVLKQALQADTAILNSQITNLQEQLKLAAETRQSFEMAAMQSEAYIGGIKQSYESLRIRNEKKEKQVRRLVKVGGVLFLVAVMEAAAIGWLVR